MQIDFHHAVTYVVARLAGFDRQRAQVIGHSAQYVDDATNGGEIRFTNGAAYTRIASAHKMLDYRNFQALANATVWVPFHFFPGNGGYGPREEPSGRFITKLVCRPDSPPARDMVAHCIAHARDRSSLHRLGISMHSYVDTWAHQGFAGVSHEVNLVSDLRDERGEPDHGLLGRLKEFFGQGFDALQSKVADKLPLGHGAALTHPDMPFLRWSYTNGLGERVERDNLADFCTAARRMFDHMVEYRAALGEKDLPSSMRDADARQIRRNFEQFTDRSGEIRHRQWCTSIANAEFSFGAEALSYIPKGSGSWKHAALDTEEDRQTYAEGYEFRPAFVESDWKLFHDALQTHRLYVLHEILPRYGIVAA